MTETSFFSRWYVVATSLALMLVVIVKMLSVGSQVGDFAPLYKHFGAELSEVTIFVLSYNSLICMLIALVSCSSFLGILFIQKIQSSKITKSLYMLSLASFVSSYVWYEFVITAVYEPIFNLGGGAL